MPSLTPLATRPLARSAVLWAWLALLLACLIIIGRSQFVADLSAFLPGNPNAEQRVLVEQLKDGTLARMILVAIEGGQADTRHNAAKALAARLRQDENFSTVQNGSAATLAQDRAYYFDNRYLLSPRTQAEHFTAAGLQSAIQDSLDSLSGGAGLLLKNLLSRDPTGETLSLLDTLSPQGGPRTVADTWVSPDDRRALLLLQTRAAGADIDGIAHSIDLLKQHFAAVQQGDPQASALHLIYSGAGVFSVHSRERIKHDTSRLALLSTLCVVALLFSVYRSFTLLALGLLPVLSGALVGIAAVSLGFGHVHGLTLGFGTTLIGEAIDYAIYYFIQTEAQNSPAQTQRFWYTVLLGVATSICGFAALLVSGFPGLAQLGLYSIAGLLTAALFTRTLLPRLTPANFQLRDVSRLGRTLKHYCTRLQGLRWLWLALIMAALAHLVIQRQHIWNLSLSALNPISLHEQQLDAELRQALGASDSRYLLALQADTQEAALQRAEQLAPLLDQLIDQQLIAGYESPAKILPSAALQRARQTAIPNRDTLEKALQDATQTLPLRAEKLTGFADDLEKARQQPLLTRQALNGSASAVAFDNMLIPQNNRYRLLLPLKSLGDNGIDPAKLQRALQQNAIPDALLIDLRDQAENLYSGYLTEALHLALWGFLAVVAVLTLSLRKLTPLLRVLTPLVGAVLLVMSGLLLCGQQLSILHLIGLLLTVAIGSNYALFFNTATADDSPAAQQRMLVSLVLANLSTVLGFGLLATSSISVLQALGLSVGPGALLSLILAAAFAPSDAQT